MTQFLKLIFLSKYTTEITFNLNCLVRRNLFETIIEVPN